MLRLCNVLFLALLRALKAALNGFYGNISRQRMPGEKSDCLMFFSAGIGGRPGLGTAHCWCNLSCGGAAHAGGALAAKVRKRLLWQRLLLDDSASVNTSGPAKMQETADRSGKSSKKAPIFTFPFPSLFASRENPSGRIASGFAEPALLPLRAFCVCLMTCCVIGRNPSFNVFHIFPTIYILLHAA